MKFEVACLLVATAMLSGCGPKLSHIEDYSMAVGEIIEVPLSPIGREQTIKIAATSPGKPIKVHVYLAEHAEAANEAILFDKTTDHLLASEEGAEQVALHATVPAGKEAIVRFQPAGPTSAEVHLEITN